MAEKHTRSFTTKRGEFTVRVMQDKLAAHAEEDVGHAKSDRKFNIRVKQDDVCLLDALAKTHGVTRSTLINQILHDILRDELMSIEEGDARVLLAHVADLSASYDDLSLPWVYDALGPNFRHMLHSMLEYSNPHGQPPDVSMSAGYQYTEEDYRSPTYLGLRDKLKGLAK
ncbi:hypothetical protein [Paracoccus sp. S3-43]|uniref:hypothetical protein n=1 Tax=Paracoccus sp. S3-43 TaxID=3030011 RepID=UPI0023AEF35F|nr:hypothetical protein [Paracoccus sp. S3-43]WEF22879.1 hypothetical protein PXD02_08425 [Paracoccus sp. S3-43]